MEIVNGIDLVDFGRIAELVERHGQRFLDRIYTQGEQAYAGKHKNPTEKYAGRFAAKEAILKLIGTGWRGKIAWTDIEVVNDAMGRPVVTLSGEVARIAAEQGIGKVNISITHTGDFAIASAVALKS